MEIAIISGKGGTGKSSIISALISQLDRVIAVDCDVDASNLHLILHPTKDGEEVYISGYGAVIDQGLCTACDICYQHCRFEAIDKIDGRYEVNSLACEGCFLCSRVCPVEAIDMIAEDKSRVYHGKIANGRMVYGRLAPGEENSGKMINRLRELSKEIAREEGYETIILDGPPGISCPVISTVTGINKVIIVTEPTISGLSDLKRTVELVEQFKVECWVIINKYDLNREMGDKIESWCKERGIGILARLPFDSSVVEAMVEGKTIFDYAPNSPFAKALPNLSDLL